MASYKGLESIMADYEFTLPQPPSINGYRAVARGRLITSKRGREYFIEVADIMKELNLDDEMIEQKVLISLVIHPRTLAKFDVSNYLKAYEDALVKCCFLEDDHWIEYGSIRKGEKVKGGLLKVKVDLID
jgi:crossover junction endodeoxyribonuclease RusA